MKIEVLPDAEAAALRCAAFIAAAAREAIGSRGRFVLAVSGGTTPGPMLRALAAQEIAWGKVDIFQSDERAAPAGSDERNLTHLWADLLARVPLRAVQVHPMPVEEELGAGAASYARALEAAAGTPPVLDAIHLGLGTDGHTASLVPADPVLAIDDAEVAIAGVYRGRRRMTLTYRCINRARHIIWLVTGGAKADALARLYAGDATLPAGRVNRERATLFADRTAASRLDAVSRQRA